MPGIKNEINLDPIICRDYKHAVNNLSENITRTKYYLDDFKGHPYQSQLGLIEKLFSFHQNIVANKELTATELNNITSIIVSITGLVQDIVVYEINESNYDDKENFLKAQKIINDGILSWQDRLEKLVTPHAIELNKFLSQSFLISDLPLISSIRSTLESAKEKYPGDEVTDTLESKKIQYVEDLLLFFEEDIKTNNKLSDLYKINFILMNAHNVIASVIKSSPTDYYSRLLESMHDYENKFKAFRDKLHHESAIDAADSVSLESFTDESVTTSDATTEESLELVTSTPDVAIKPDEEVDTVTLTAGVYKNCKENLSKLNGYILIIQSNKKLSKLIGEELFNVIKLRDKIELNADDIDQLIKANNEIIELIDKIWTEDVHYAYELERLKSIATAKGLNSVFSVFLQPENRQTFTENLARVEDVKLRGKVSTRELAITLELTNNYLINPISTNEHALNSQLDKLPQNSHLKFYLKAIIISTICVSLIAGLVVLSIYNPSAAHLAGPIFQATGSFFANLLNVFPPLAELGSTIANSIVAAGQHTAFVMPGISPFASHKAVPVWSLVGGGIAGAITAMIANKFLNTNKKAVKNNTDDETDLETESRSILSYLSTATKAASASLSGFATTLFATDNRHSMRYERIEGHDDIFGDDEDDEDDDESLVL